MTLLFWAYVVVVVGSCVQDLRAAARPGPTLRPAEPRLR